MQHNRLRDGGLSTVLLTLLTLAIASSTLADDTKSATPPAAQDATTTETAADTPGDTTATPATARDNTAPADKPAAEPPPPRKREVFPNLAKALRSIDGVVKAEYANTPGGKLCVFGWFENKEAAKRWYLSAVHQGLLDTFFPDRIEREPMFLVPDDIGPMMAVACFTPPKEPGGSIRQIAVELYAPLHGGFSANGRFGPDEWKGIFEHYDQYEHTEEFRQRMRDQIKNRNAKNPVTDVPLEAGTSKDFTQPETTPEPSVGDDAGGEKKVGGGGAP